MASAEKLSWASVCRLLWVAGLTGDEIRELKTKVLSGNPSLLTSHPAYPGIAVRYDYGSKTYSVHTITTYGQEK